VALAPKRKKLYDLGSLTVLGNIFHNPPTNMESIPFLNKFKNIHSLLIMASIELGKELGPRGCK
jgi:hypothetical protein